MRKAIKILALSAVSLLATGIVACGEKPHVHSYSEVVTAPTCMKRGYTTNVCSCGDSYLVEGSEVAPVGHHGGTATCTEYPICDDCGYGYGELGEHTFVDAVCSNCYADEGSVGLSYTLSSDGQSYTLTSIGFCLENDIGIPSIYKGKPVTAIADNVFYNNNTLTSIRLAKNVEKIGTFALGNCRNLKTIKIDPENDSFVIENGALYTADRKTLIVYAPKTEGESFVVPDSVEIISAGAFAKSGLKSIHLGNNVKTIGDGAFAWASVESLVIPNSLQSVGERAFFKSSVVTTISENVKYLGNADNPYLYAVGVSGSATSYTLHAQTKLVETSIFSDCTSLTSIKVADGNTAFKEIDGNLYSADGKTLLRYATAKSALGFNIPETVTAIGANAFSGCTKIQRVNIHDGVISIARKAFYGCKNLTVYFEGKTAPSSWDKNWNYSYCPVAYGYQSTDGISILNAKATEKGANLTLVSPTVSKGSLDSFTVEYQRIGDDAWKSLNVAGGQKFSVSEGGWYQVRYTLSGKKADNSALDATFIAPLFVNDSDIAFDFEGDDPFHGGTYYYPGGVGGVPRYEIVHLENNNRAFMIWSTGESWEGIFFDKPKTIGKTCKGIRLRIYSGEKCTLQCSITSGAQGYDWQNAEIQLETGWNDVYINLPDFEQMKGITFKQSRNISTIIIDDIRYIEK